MRYGHIFIYKFSLTKIHGHYITHEAYPRRNVYWSQPTVCLFVCLSLSAFPHYCMDPDVSWGNGRGCHLVVQYWADLESLHGFRCYDNIVPNAKCQQVLVLTLCLF